MRLYSHCSVFLGNIREAFAKNSDLTNLLMDDFFTKAIHDCQVGSQAIYTLQDTCRFYTSTHTAAYLPPPPAVPSPRMHYMILTSVYYYDYDVILLFYDDDSYYDIILCLIPFCVRGHTVTPVNPKKLKFCLYM